MKKIIEKIIAIKISALLVFQQTLIAGSIIVDNTAPLGNQATVEASRNNVPVVNIVAPNTKGLSHNKFSDYNVNKEGVILNNSNQRDVNTQLSGYIYGNKNLVGGATAKTILNEVTSKNKSELKGFTEVAGDKANVVVANPNGIYINGAGFINTSKATITTGKINIDNNQIKDFEVKNGEIQIDGGGLNTTNVDKAELYAKTVKLNAQIHAKDIDVVTGENKILENGTIEKIENEDSEKPIFSLDSSNLGGIYANKINLIGTQDGVGVNLPIEIASQDNLKISADGKIVVKKVIASNDINIKSKSNSINSEVIYANNVNMNAKNEIVNADTIASKNNIELVAQKITNENLIASGVTGELKDSVNGNLNITSDELENKNTLYSKDNITIDSTNIKNSQNSNINSKKAINIKSKNIENEDNVTIQAKDDITIKNENEIVSNNSKILSQEGSIDINTNFLKNVNGYIGAKEDINIVSKDIDNSNGAIITNENLNVNSEGEGLFNNFKGVLKARKNLVLDVFNFQGDESNIQAQEIKINANNVDAKSSNIVAIDGNLELKANNVNLNNSSQIAALKDVKIDSNDTKMNNTKILSQEGGIDLKVNNLEINKSIVNVAKDINLKVTNEILAQDVDIQGNKIDINSKSLLLSNENTKENGYNSKLISNTSMNINTNNLKNVNGYIGAKEDVNITSKNIENSKGVIITNGNLNINSEEGGFLNNIRGILQAGKNLVLNVFNFQGDESTIQAQEIKINANDVNAKSSNIVATDGDLKLDIQNNIDFSNDIIIKGLLYSTNNILINSKKFISNYLNIQANNNIDINSLDIILNNNIIQSAVNINETYENGYKQGNINLITNRLDLNNTTLISKDLSIKNQENNKLEKLIVNNSILDVNNDINILATNFNTKDSTYSSLRSFFLQTNNIKDKNNNTIFSNSVFKSGNSMNITIDDNIELDSTNSFEASNSVILNSKSLTNNAQFISNDNITINASDYIINNGLLSSGNIINLNATNYITNNDSNEALFGIKGAFVNLNTNLLTNYGLISSLYEMNIQANDIINYGGIASSNTDNYSSVMSITADNLTNYNTIYSNDSINLFIKNNLLNKTADNLVDLGSEKATIYATNNIEIQGNKDKTLRTQNIINDKSIIQTQYGDIGIFAKQLNNIGESKFDYEIVQKNFANKSQNLTEQEVVNELRRLLNSGELSIVTCKSSCSGNFAIKALKPIFLEKIKEFFPDLPTNNKEELDAFFLLPNSTISLPMFYNEIVNKTITNASQIIAKNISLDIENVNNIDGLISANNNLNMEIKEELVNKTSEERVNVKDKNLVMMSETWKRSKRHGAQISNMYLEEVDKILLIEGNSVIEGKNISGNIKSNLINGSTFDKEYSIGDIELVNYKPMTNTDIVSSNLSTTTKKTQNKTDFSTGITVSTTQKEKLNEENIIVETIKDDYTLPSNKFGMFTTVDLNKNLDYLVESNPLYTNLSNYTGSQYFLDKMNYKSDRTTKRLGDAAYETKLVTEAIIQQTGQRFLNSDYTSENAQFVALLNNAVNLSGILDLEIGKALTTEQLANLTDDIVWMEEKIVNGQRVLVPVVYLLSDYEHLKGSSIVAGNSIDLKINSNVNNSGNIKAKDYINLDANSITNNAGVILSNGDIKLISNKDFINKNEGLIKGNDLQISSLDGEILNNNSKILANENLLLNASKDIINENVSIIKGGNVQLISQEGSIANKIEIEHKTLGEYLSYDKVVGNSQIEATNGSLVIQANKDITNIGANLTAKNNLVLQTQNGDINLNAVEVKKELNITFKGGFNKALNIENLYSTASGENIVINSGNNINLEASKLNASNQINLNAQNDVNIMAVNNVNYEDVQTSKKGTFSKSTTRNMTYKEEVQSAELNANDIVINANNNVNLEASKLKAQDNIIVNAKEGDVNILAKEYKEGELHQTSKSSFGGLKKSLDISSSDALKLNSALLETQAANVVISSGKDINILASEINSGADIQLKALNEVLIASQEEYLKTKEVHEKSSFNIAGLAGLVAPVDVSIYSQEIHKNDKVSSTNVSSNLKAKENIIVDSGSTTIVGSNLEANNISIKADTGEINILSSQDIKNETSLDKKIELSLSNPIDMIKGQLEGLKDGQTKLKFEVGSLTYDEVDKASSSVKNNSSNLIAKENLVLDSLTDINIKGSNLKADENLVLNSTVGDINILNTTDTYNEDIKEKHAKASVNLTVQNEYVETAQAVKSAVESAKQLKQTKEDYSNYKGEVKKLENTLSNLKQSYKNKEVGIDYSDIEDLSDIIDNLKSQEKYYVAAIAAATADLTSKTVAIATQATAAGTSGATAGFSAGVSLDVNGEKSKQNVNNQTSNASNLNAKNIIINTDEKLSTNTNIVGSNVIANENLYINTNNLNVKASQDNYVSSNDSESINGSIAFTMYGGGGGTAGLGYGQQNSNSNSIINNNSQLEGNNVNINASNDAIFQGANVKANETLNLNVGNNLVLESLRDEYSSNSNGFNVNAGIGFGSAGATANRTPSLDVGKQSSTNAGMSVNNGTTLNKQTVLSSITGDKVNVNVGNNTHLKGALISAGNFTEDGSFVDNKNLNFITNTLTFENLSNSSFSSNQSIGGNLNYNLDSTKIVDGQKKAQQGGISSVKYQAENSLSVNASKTLATLGQGNVIIKDKENSDDLERLNTDTSKINKELYSSSTGTKVDATLDTRLLTEDGRNQIAEDIERTKRLGQAIGDVASSDSLNIKDTFDHIDDVQKDLDVQKALALKDKGQTISILENQQNYSQEQIDIALNNYAQIYADVYGVNIENAKIAILGKYGSTYTNGDNTNSNVYLDKILNQNALQTANTLGHEVAHVRQNQGQTYLRDTTQLQEEYANLFGNYSSNGLDFSSYVYNNVKLNNIPSLNLNLTSQDVNTLKTNTSLYVKDLSKANSGDGRVDDESYWTLQDMNRAKDLQSDNASDRIKALIETGNTESEVLKQVINDGTLRGLSQEEFNKIYSEQKQQVDDTNKLVDIEANSLKTISLALGGREITKNILESISKKTVETSIKNAIASGVEDLSTQVGLQIFDIIYNEPAILNQINNNPADTLNEIYNKIDLEKINLNEIMIASTIGSFSDTKYDGIKELKERILARNTILNQINNPNLTSTTKKLKLEEKLSSIDSEIKKRVGTIVTPIIIEQIVTQKPREIIEGVLSND